MLVNKMELTIEQIENDFWDDGEFPTGLVERISQLRKKRICEFNDDDLRIAIQQRICLELIMPIAVDRIRQDLLLEAFYYPGDLLMAIVGAGEYWGEHLEARDDFRNYLNAKRDLLQATDITDEIRNELLRCISLL